MSHKQSSVHTSAAAFPDVSFLGKHDVFVADVNDLQSIAMPSIMGNTRMDQLDFFALGDDGHIQSLSPAMLSAMTNDVFLTPAASQLPTPAASPPPLTPAQRTALAEAQHAQDQQPQLSIPELRNLAAQMQAVDSTAATELRRQMHIQCEQKRRAQIKDGFEEIKAELPGYQHKKMSKALILSKSLDFVRRLKSEREVMVAEIERLRHENEALRSALNK